MLPLDVIIGSYSVLHPLDSDFVVRLSCCTSITLAMGLVCHPDRIYWDPSLLDFTICCQANLLYFHGP